MKKALLLISYEKFQFFDKQNKKRHAQGTHQSRRGFWVARNADL